MRVLIVDDHAVFRLGLRAALEEVAACEVVGEAGTARQALALVDQLGPDLVLMDLALPGMDGATATREVRRRAPAARVLVVSLHEQTPDVLEALDAGAHGYALKSEGLAALLVAVQTVARGDRYVAPSLLDRLAAYRRRGDRAADTLAVLSQREREVFRLAADGLCNGEIARELCISRKTVDTHRYRINQKLALRTAADLVRLAAALGILHVGRVGPGLSAGPAEPDAGGSAARQVEAGLGL
jgi:DNA-binding NarL/FixJ family response regulator